MRKANILIISQGIDGGVAAMCSLLAGGLEQRGYDVSVLYVGRPAISKFMDVDKSNNVQSRVISTGKARTISEALGLLLSIIPVFLKVLKDKPNAVIFGGFIPATLYAPILRLFSKARFIYWDHAPQNTFQRVKKLVFPIVKQCIDVFVSISSSTAQAMTNYFGVSRDEIVIIPNGIQAASWVAVPPAPPLDKLRIIMPGRLDLNQKDQLTLIGAAKLLHDKGIPIDVMLVGAGVDKSKIIEAIERAAAQSYVHLIAHSNDVPALLAKCNILCLSSNFEGLPLVLIEGLFARRIIVASRVVGCVDIIRHGENGFLFEAGSPEDCADVLQSLFGRENIGLLTERAFGEANDIYALEKMVTKFEKVLLS